MLNQPTPTDATAAIGDNNANENTTAAPRKQIKRVDRGKIKKTCDPNGIPSPVALDPNDPDTEPSVLVTPPSFEQSRN
jgi:hypothetical protein